MAKLEEAIKELFISNNNHIGIVSVQEIKCLAVQVAGQVELIPITDDTYDSIQEVLEKVLKEKGND